MSKCTETKKNYKNAKIYIIRNTENDKLYVGSTTEALSRRMAKHRYTSHKCPDFPLYNAFIEIGVNKFYIELLEKYPCDSNEQLLAREGHYIREYNTHNEGYNKLLAGRTQKEYKEEYKEKIKQYLQNYNEENKERITHNKKEKYERNKEKTLEAKKSERVRCKCGSETRRDVMSRHEKTKKHQDWLANQPSTSS